MHFRMLHNWLPIRHGAAIAISLSIITSTPTIQWQPQTGGVNGGKTWQHDIAMLLGIGHRLRAFPERDHRVGLFDHPTFVTESLHARLVGSCSRLQVLREELHHRDG